MDYDRLRELQEKFEENPRRYFAPLANEYRKGGQPKRAIEICRAQLAQMPGHMSGQIVFGQALYEAGEFEEARQVFERALTLDPENLIALRTLGDMSLQSGNTGEARNWYTRLLDADPKDTAVIALVSEIDASADAAPVAPPQDIPVDADAGDQPIPYITDDAGVGTAHEASVPQSPASQSAAQQSAAPEISMEPEPVAAPHFAARENTPAPPSPALPEPETTPAPQGAAASRSDDDAALDAWTPPPGANVHERVESRKEDRMFSGPGPEPFVNETMAQLYLQQGYRQLALKVYYQLAEARPNDQGLKDKIAEIEAADRAAHPESAEARREPSPVERPPPPPAAPRSPSIESPTPARPPESEESPSFDRSPIDSPPSQPFRERESIESPARDEPEAEPEGIAASQPSIREFFATLGRQRPPRAGSTAANAARGANNAPSEPPPPPLATAAPGASLDAVFAGATEIGRAHV